MSDLQPGWVEHQRKRWQRPDWQRWMRHDAHRFAPPDPNACRSYATRVIEQRCAEAKQAEFDAKKAELLKKI